MVFMADQYTSEVLPPGEQPFHLPAAPIPTERAAILGFGAFTIRSVRRNHLGPYRRQSHIQGVALVRLIANQPGGGRGGKGRSESMEDKGDFMRRSSRRVDGDRKTSAVCHRHELRTLAPLGRSHAEAPFLRRRRCRR